MTIIYAFTVYCLTCSGIEPLSASDHYFATYDICVREARKRIESAFPPGLKYDISCLLHPVPASDHTTIERE